MFLMYFKAAEFKLLNCVNLLYSQFLLIAQKYLLHLPLLAVRFESLHHYSPK